MTWWLTSKNTLSCVLSLSHMVSQVKCGTWLYCFQMFAFFLTLRTNNVVTHVKKIPYHVFCHFPIWCPRSSVVLDFIYSWCLPSSLLIEQITWWLTSKNTLSCVLSLSHMVSQVKCGTWFYLFLMFAFFLTYRTNNVVTHLKKHFIVCFVTFPYGFPDQVWYLIVLFPNVCLLSYFENE